jgi:hypothetical protein
MRGTAAPGPSFHGCKTRYQRISRYAAGRPRRRRGFASPASLGCGALLGPLWFTAIEVLRTGHSSPWRARDTVSCRVAVSAAGHRRCSRAQPSGSAAGGC